MLRVRNARINAASTLTKRENPAPNAIRTRKTRSSLRKTRKTRRNKGGSSKVYRQANRDSDWPLFSLAFGLRPPIFYPARTPCVRKFSGAEKEKLTYNLTLNLRCPRNVGSR